MPPHSRCTATIRGLVNLYRCERLHDHRGEHTQAQNGIRASWSDGHDTPRLRNAPMAGSVRRITSADSQAEYDD